MRIHVAERQHLKTTHYYYYCGACYSHLLPIHRTSHVQGAASEVDARPPRVASVGRVGGAYRGRQAAVSIVPFRKLQ